MAGKIGYLTVPEYARKVGTTRQNVHLWIKHGALDISKLIHLKKVGRWLVREDVEAPVLKIGRPIKIKQGETV